MDPLVRNLSITKRTSWNDTLLNNVRELANRFPFEQRRTKQLGLKRADDLEQFLGVQYEGRFLLTAHFQEDLVGVLGVTELPTANGSSLVLRHEMLQRNRDDIRRKLFRELAERKPGAKLSFELPAQNRTARQYLHNLPLFEIQNHSLMLCVAQSLTDGSDNDATHPNDVLATAGLDRFQTPRRRWLREHTEVDAMSLSQQPWELLFIEDSTSGQDATDLTARRLSPRSSGGAARVWSYGKTSAVDWGAIGNRLRNHGVNMLEWLLPADIEDAIPADSPWKIIGKRVHFSGTLSA